MRDFGPVNFFLGDTEAERVASTAYIAAARTQLGILKNGMALGGLQQNQRNVALPDGTVIRCQSITGVDTIRITPTSASVAAAKKQLADETQEKRAATGWIVAGLVWGGSGPIPTVWTARGIAALPLGGYAYGQATIVAPGGKNVIGWVWNGTYQLACWWSASGSGWALHVGDFQYYTTFDVVTPHVVGWNGHSIMSIPVPTAAGTGVSPQVVVLLAYQTERTFFKTGVGFATVPGMLAAQVTFGGVTKTIGWSQIASYGFSQDLSLDDWVSITNANTPDLTGYLPTDGLGAFEPAAQFGPYLPDPYGSDSITPLGTCGRFITGHGLSGWQLIYDTGSASPSIFGFLLNPSNFNDPSGCPTYWTHASLGGEWFVGYAFTGMRVQATPTISVTLTFEEYRPVRSNGTGITFLDHVVGSAAVVTGAGTATAADTITTSGRAFGGTNSSTGGTGGEPPGLTGVATWAPGSSTETYIFAPGSNSPGLESASISGDAACGSVSVGGEDMPWVWVSGVARLLPLAVGAVGGYAEDVADGGALLVGEVYDVDGNFWAALWVNGQVALTISEDIAFFNSVGLIR